MKRVVKLTNEQWATIRTALEFERLRMLNEKREDAERMIADAMNAFYDAPFVND